MVFSKLQFSNDMQFLKDSKHELGLLRKCLEKKLETSQHSTTTPSWSSFSLNKGYMNGRLKRYIAWSPQQTSGPGLSKVWSPMATTLSKHIFTQPVRNIWQNFN